MFICVGHYVKDLSAYKSLVEKINSYHVSSFLMYYYSGTIPTPEFSDIL